MTAVPTFDGAAGLFLRSLHERAAASPRTILFPEATDVRTLEAVMTLEALGSVVPVLVRRNDAPMGMVPSPSVGMIDPLLDARTPRVVEHLLARRGAKGLSREDAERLACDPLYFADSLVALGEADGCVAGAVHTTADVLRAAIFNSALNDAALQRATI